MKRILLTTIFFLALYSLPFAQKVTYSDFSRTDDKNMNFEIIGKISNHFLVYKNIKSNHHVSVYDNEMAEVQKVKLDFVPDRIFNIEFIAYPDFFYMIYQYQKRGILYCMGAKMDGNGNILADPVIIDTTSVGAFGDNKIYTTIYSEDKNQIMVFKIRKRNDLFNITTILFNKELNPVKKTLLVSSYDDRRDIYGDFLVANDGSFLFTKGIKPNNRDDINNLQLVIKKPLSDTFNYYDLNLDKKSIDEVQVKIDNLNK